MSDNIFSTSPLRIILFDPLQTFTGGIREIHVLVGKTKPAVSAALLEADAARKSHKAISSRCDTILRDYYGPKYRKRLALGNDWQHYTVASIDGQPVKTGGADGDPDDLDEFHRLLNETNEIPTVSLSQASTNPTDTSQPDSPPVYYDSMTMFPMDTFASLREKIFAAIGIPIYRQHICYRKIKSWETTYDFLVSGGITSSIALFLSEIPESSLRIAGIPIDKELFDERKNIAVSPRDQFMLVNQEIAVHDIFVIDLDYFLQRRNRTAQLAAAIADPHQLDMIYYGFVLKYWPQFTKEAFADYLMGPETLSARFPDLAADRSAYVEKCREETAILAPVYSNNVENLNAAKQISTAITQLVAEVSTLRIELNIRNLFDALTTRAEMPEIMAVLQRDNKTYRLIKRHASSRNAIKWPTNNSMCRNGVSIAWRTTPLESTEPIRWIFVNWLPNGKYLVSAQWHEEEAVNFADLVPRIQHIINPLCRSINKFGKWVFVSGTAIDLMTPRNTIYQGLTACLYWKQILSTNSFRAFTGMLAAYNRAGIINMPIIAASEIQTFQWKKGTYDFDHRLIDRASWLAGEIAHTNKYAYLTSREYRARWETLYGGRNVTMNHRITDIRWEVSNIKQTEFMFFVECMTSLFAAASKNPSIKLGSEVTSSKPLKKLYEQDPELYDIKKYGSKVVYSKRCQRSHQPTIYTSAEVRAMTQRARDGLTKYWNFTYKHPAWYGCKNPNYPHLTFLVGAHPKNYCLPCCQKEPNSQTDAKKARVRATCLLEHKYERRKDDATSRYVTHYGKDIHVGRLTYLPNTDIVTVFDTSNETFGYFIYGVPQQLPGGTGLGAAFAIAHAVRTTIEKLITEYTRLLRDKPEIFDALLQGLAHAYFNDIGELCDAMMDLFVHKKHAVSRSFGHWSDLLLHIHAIFFSTDIYILDDRDGFGDFTLVVGAELRYNILYGLLSRGLILLRANGAYHPIYAVDLADYWHTGHISSRLFAPDSPAVQSFSKMIKTFAKSEKYKRAGRHDYAVLFAWCQSNDWQIRKKYLNKQHKCYAVLIAKNHTEKNSAVYVPIKYSPVIADGAIISSVPYSGEIIHESTVQEWAGQFNAWIGANFTTGGICRYCTIEFTHRVQIGDTICALECRGATDTMYFYLTNPSLTGELPITILHYDPRELNAAIIERMPPAKDNRHTLLAEALWRNNAYRLFVMEFAWWIARERDEQRHEQLQQLIKSCEKSGDYAGIQPAARKILADYPADLDGFNKLSIDANTGEITNAEFAQIISDVQWDFDKITMNKFRALGAANSSAIYQQRELLQSIMKKMTTANSSPAHSAENRQFPNIFMPCHRSAVLDDTQQPIFCDADKLILLEPLAHYVDLLAADLNNPLKSSYMLDNLYVENVVDYFDFVKHPWETIEIYSVLSHLPPRR